MVRSGWPNLSTYHCYSNWFTQTAHNAPFLERERGGDREGEGGRERVREGGGRGGRGGREKGGVGRKN